MQFTVAIPKDWEITVKEGDTVDFTTPLLQSAVKKQATIPLSQTIGIKPDKIFNYIKKYVGDEVKKGDVLAEAKKLLFSKKYISEYDGILKEVNHLDGHIVIEYNTEEKSERQSFVKGLIEKISQDDPLYKILTVQSTELEAYDISDPTDYFGGEVVYFDKSTVGAATEEQVSGKVVVVDELGTYDITKLDALDVKAFVTLQPLGEKVHVPAAKLDKNTDWAVISERKLPYCTVDFKEGKILFYK